MTPTELKRLKEICDKATPGPWVHSSSFHLHSTFEGLLVSEMVGPVVMIRANRNNFQKNNGTFIAEARHALPELIAEVERLRDALEKIKQEVGTSTRAAFIAREALFGDG